MHIKSISKETGLPVNMIANEALDYALYSKYFKVLNDIFIYDESKYIDKDSKYKTRVLQLVNF